MKTRERVLQYRERHPTATVRDIQIALGISSPSVVQFHLTNASQRATMESLIRKYEHALMLIAEQISDKSPREIARNALGLKPRK